MLKTKEMLDTLIQQKRAQMIQVGMTLGLLSAECIRISQELDVLIHQYQLLFS